MSIAATEDFGGTERFTIESRLGAGAFGVVYRARDRKHDGVVALKTLRRADSDALFRFKHEFRSLADIAHRNLVTLYELLSDGDQWFFTMELVEGVNFLEHVRGSMRRDAGESSRPGSASDGTTAALTAGGERPAGERRAPGPADPLPGVPAGAVRDRLRPALLQLAEGLRALHAAGKLHRDIKPSNVLVSTEGRVVLLDFGLISDLGPEGFLQSLHLVGTPAYMSPEQAAGRPVTEASDWYGVGVILYEALTGTRPFPGEHLDVLFEKQQSEPAPPAEVAAGVPDDLNALCRDLLRRNALDRPSGDEVLRALRSAAMPSAPRRTAAPPPRPAPFVGRRDDLAAMAEAFEATRGGRAVAVLVRGSSGVGKTALVRRFLEGVRAAGTDTVVLEGRCYEQETVPYKAVDSLIDALAQYLRRLPAGEAEALLPRDLLALAQLFPVLRQVDAVALARRRVVAIPDSLEQRRRGFRALRELLARLSDRAPLVLFIDDLQWGDVDSAALLSELIRPPEPPPLLLIGCFRVEDGADSLLWTALSAVRSAGPAEVEIRGITVGDLPPQDAETLARALLDTEDSTGVSSAESIARESRGNPFFIDELARWLRAGSRPAPASGALLGAGTVSLDDVIWARVSLLPEDARRLLETVAVAGRPLERMTARRAAGLAEDDQAALAVLRVGHLLRGAGAGPEEQVEIYHDRIRQTVVSRLSAKTREAAHQRLAFALEASGVPDPESLAVHYQGGGSRERAAIYAADAAAKAARALAFDRAARLYQLALELGTTDVAERQRLRVRLGDALANAGRGGEAAQAYLAAAEGAGTGENLELQRRAAEQLLQSGHVDEGLAVLRKVLDRIGMKLPSTPRGALLSFLLRRIQLRLRGFSFVERSVTEIPAENLIRIDACWSVSTGLSLVDTIRGRDFQTRHMLLALKAGEPYRIARAMGNEAGYSAFLDGCAGRRRTQRLVDRALALAERVQHPHAFGMAYLAAGIGAYLEGRWETSWDIGRRCEEILREQCTGVTWELDMVHVYSLKALVFLGRLAELSERLPKFVKEARERGDLFAATSLQTRHSYVLHLMADDPEGARAALRRAAEGWSQQSFFMQHYFQLFSEAEISLYEGSGRNAWSDLLDHWWGLEKSLLRRSQLFLIESQHLRARCALAAACGESAGPERLRRLRSVSRDARRIERERTPWGDPLAELIRAGAASVRGAREESIERLRAAEAGLELAQMMLYAAAARRCRGLMLGGREGAERVAAADAWMADQRIRNPARMTAMLAPGRWAAAPALGTDARGGPLPAD